MINITLKDGSKIQVESGSTAYDVAVKISQGLAKKALGARVNGESIDLMKKLDTDCELEILTFDDEDGRWDLRHTASHILAQAVKKLYPNAKLAIGPAIDNGFYYDFDLETPFTPEDLEKIEKEMEKIVKEKIAIERFELPRDEAIKFMKDKDEPYKVELIEDLPEGEVISFYRQGDFVDLCAGPHVPNTSYVKAFKLTSIAGAYWRGNSDNKMLQRIYGTAFPKKKDLDEYIEKLEEAKKRDHRKIGKELKLFTVMEEGPGFPFFLPKGMILKNKIIEYWRELHKKYNYVEIETPIILNQSLWETSGHWDHYRDNMYTLKIDDENYAIKPMNCPGGMLVYKSETHSYKELPMRVAEMGRVHRHELSGALHGLMRVRAFTQDDAHIFMLPEQIKDEIKDVIKLVNEIYTTFGFKYDVELSTKPENSMGSEEDWRMAEESLQAALDELGMKYKINPGDGAFYGPKIDFHLQDSIGRTWQCGTIQLDFQLPQRFDLSYIGKDGEKHKPIVIHRAILGSLERFIAILTENFAGKFPSWIAPVQVKVLPISDKFMEYAKEVVAELQAEDIRVELDDRAEKIGYKIREARNERVPYIAVIGEKEQNEATLALRSRDKGEEGNIGVEDFIEKIKYEINNRLIEEE
ncbi:MULTISPECIES: threonine--tRNA ligase [Clostridium]|uniref:Threonine--tRNA ligase n=1 Tax=Clostridium cadaveris TaxID=1529 RepID=A0A1I2NFS1_9CLOT|nr:threonine--tRNA ligase [Clostridium cadaveris]MDM8312821.1 threonine--tRNA ligase [Clostridium cadaveris]MDU4952629.1 threonine--tRNA ligase [Clostridium sp.]SFG00537.1 threonyl-tRNA synthetase [Clostridium cadaveris]